MISVHPADARTRTDQPGIVSWHAFSAGAHYDPANVAFGPVIACDEHVVEPGAGFAEHAHARVELISWVVSGTLLHEDATGRRRTIAPGEVQRQVAGSGIRHCERNASATAPLRFVQVWLLADADTPQYEVAPPPLTLSAGSVTVLRGAAVVSAGPYVLLYVAHGRFAVAGRPLDAGGSARASGEAVPVDGAGELLVVSVHT